MVLDAEALKQRYQGKWRKSNAREYIVKAVLDVLLPDGFTAEITGLGAGSDEYIEGSYSSILDAFDITIYYMGRPATLLDATGVSSPRDALPGLGYCLGEWKLAKAEKYKVTPMTWAVFVIESEPTILWAPFMKFKTMQAKMGRLYQDERPVRCLPRRRWLKYSDFIRWLRLYGPSYANYLEKIAEGVAPW